MKRKKTKILVTLAALLILISVIVLIVGIEYWFVSLIGFAVAIICLLSAGLGKLGKKIYTAELTYKSFDPRSSKEITWAYCELEGHEFRLTISRDVCKLEKLVPGATYKVEYTVSKNGDPSRSGDAVSLTRID